MGIKTKKFVRKPIYVDAVRVTAKNFASVMAWASGEEKLDEDRGTGTTKKYIFIDTPHAKHARQKKAFIGDWVLKTDKGFKIYSNYSFHRSFDASDIEQQTEVTVDPGQSDVFLKWMGNDFQAYWGTLSDNDKKQLISSWTNATGMPLAASEATPQDSVTTPPTAIEEVKGKIVASDDAGNTAEVGIPERGPEQEREESSREKSIRLFGIFPPPPGELLEDHETLTVPAPNADAAESWVPKPDDGVDITSATEVDAETVVEEPTPEQLDQERKYDEAHKAAVSERVFSQSGGGPVDLADDVAHEPKVEDSPTAPPAEHNGQRVITLAEQKEMTPSEVTDLLRGGDAILEQDLQQA